MKILQLAQKPQRRGAEVFTHQLSASLSRAGHTVQTVYLYPSTGATALSVEPPASSGLGGNEAHLTERLLGSNPALLRKLVSAIVEFDPDIVQSNGARTLKYGAFARKRLADQRWRLVYRNIGDPSAWLLTWHYRLFYTRMVMPHVDGVVAVSRATLASLLEIYGQPKLAAQIPIAVDPDALRPRQSPDSVRKALHIPQGKPVVIYVGSMTREKRPDRLLRLLLALRHNGREAFLVLVGDGELRAALEQQSREMQIADSVRFLGTVDNVADYLPAADVFVLTSDTEGMPGVLLEAGYMGLPVVATDVGGVSECVLDRETGILVAPDDEDDLAAAVERLLRDEDLRRRMGDRAKQWVCERFTIDRVACQYESFYARLLQAPSA